MQAVRGDPIEAFLHSLDHRERWVADVDAADALILATGRQITYIVVDAMPRQRSDGLLKEAAADLFFAFFCFPTKNSLYTKGIDPFSFVAFCDDRQSSITGRD